MKSAVEIVYVLAMCGSLTLPFDVRRIVVVLVFSEAIIMAQRNALKHILLFMHQRPIEQQVIVHRVDFAVCAVTHEVG